VLYGAEQEHGLLPGTENVALIVAMGAAAAVASASLLALSDRLRSLRDRLHAHLEAGVPEIRLNGDPERRLPNTLHVSFPGASGRAFLASVSNTVAASVGSACHSVRHAQTARSGCRSGARHGPSTSTLPQQRSWQPGPA
jgi:cysteine desulfurase